MSYLFLFVFVQMRNGLVPKERRSSTFKTSLETEEGRGLGKELEEMMEETLTKVRLIICG